MNTPLFFTVSAIFLLFCAFFSAINDSASSPVTIALLAWSAAAAVSPPKSLMRAAENDVTCRMYSFFDLPIVRYAWSAYSSSLCDDSPYSFSTPPTSCS